MKLSLSLEETTKLNHYSAKKKKKKTTHTANCRELASICKALGSTPSNKGEKKCIEHLS
jgi:hypothetical protein